ncbi:MAG: hypothetical protein MUF60_01485, partial [Vicinamibacterales bacterium]|nr:hypothetical protein [Vicinamibacterales bacterium]
KPSAAERERLMRGEPFTKLLEGDAGREVAVFGAVWVDAPRLGYRDAVLDIERYERGRAFPVTRRMSAPPTLGDFADLTLPGDDVSDLRGCRVGDCKVKLDRESIEAFGARVDFGAPTARLHAEALFRERLLTLVTRYRTLGNAGLVEYHDDAPPVRAADEFQALVDPWPSVFDTPAELRRYLLDYPRARWPSSADLYYWQEVRFGLKPLIRLNHMVVHEGATETVVANKMLYASHYFRTALDLRVLISDPSRERGFWLVTVSRSRPDGLTGLLGRLIRGRVRSEARKGVQNMLVSAKRRLERAAGERATSQDGSWWGRATPQRGTPIASSWPD